MSMAKFKVGDMVVFKSQYLRDRVSAEPLKVLEVCEDCGEFFYSVDRKNYLDATFFEEPIQ